MIGTPQQFVVDAVKIGSVFTVHKIM